MELLYAGLIVSHDGATHALTAANFTGMPIKAKRVTFSWSPVATDMVYVGKSTLVAGTGEGVMHTFDNTVQDWFPVEGADIGWIYLGDYGIASAVAGEGCHIAVWG